MFFDSLSIIYTEKISIILRFIKIYLNYCFSYIKEELYCHFPIPSNLFNPGKSAKFIQFLYIVHQFLCDTLKIFLKY